MAAAADVIYELSLICFHFSSFFFFCLPFSRHLLTTFVSEPPPGPPPGALFIGGWGVDPLVPQPGNLDSACA